VAASHRLTSQWQFAARELGIEFEGPFTLTTPEGERHEFAGKLSQFGSEHGMLLLAEYDADAIKAASALGFGYSCLDSEPEARAGDLSSYIACLRDWGWAGSQKPPSWF
jgi:hypothetical protein